MPKESGPLRFQGGPSFSVAIAFALHTFFHINILVRSSYQYRVLIDHRAILSILLSHDLVYLPPLIALCFYHQPYLPAFAACVAAVEAAWVFLVVVVCSVILRTWLFSLVI